MASLASLRSEQELIAPERSESQVLHELSTLLAGDAQASLRLVTSDGSEIELPESVMRVLRRAADALANERAVAVEPFGRLISIVTAAQLLNLTPGAVEAVIDRHELPAVLTAGQQMLDVRDVIVWGAQHHERLLKGLDELTQMSQKMGLYDLDAS
ncbi:MAG TPA: hypothetical protein VFV93_16595 [Thermomicrobiales bacterium]|nr:hypothetical protein [Thermomicrobiales bacterium]